MRKILIVDDDRLNRMVLRGILAGEYETLEAENGEVALTLLASRGKDISAVLLDILMPVMDGYEVLRRMRANAELSHIPVIVASGTEEKDAELKAVTLGASDFVAKPYTPALILHCLRNAIRLQETISAMNALQRDKLTGIFNREAFFEQAGRLIREREPGYYIMSCFDIDNFKLINDHYGSAEGDRVLRRTAELTKRNMNDIGGLVGRVSADNFGLLFPAEYALGDSDRVAAMRDKTLTPEALRLNAVFRFGRCVVNDISLPPSALYDRAFLAKQSIKGRYDVRLAYFDETMLDKLIREQEVIAEMDSALASRQFEVWFQPQFNHSTGALIGSEALVRWRHPEKGLIPPDLFIPVFERNGFIYEMDKYVWERACADLRKWLDSGLSPLPVSVNISRYDIFRADLVEVISGLTEKYSLPIELLRLEITESAFARSAAEVISVVRTLVDKGFLMEIDDFGSGYSSLNTLKDVPAQVLKLDMRFLESSENSQRGGNILESVVRMAKWLDMTVIAEGVETLEQADFLKSIGCSYVQGYLYGKPMPVSEYEGLLADAAVREARLPALKTVKNLDNNAFWDPHSMDTLIFNSYIGGACVFEYHRGHIEILRANDKYAQVMGSAGMTVEEALRLNWAEHLDEDSKRVFLDAVRRSIETGDEVTRDFVFLSLPGCPAKTYLRTTMRVIASYSDRYLIYCTNENLTRQREAEQKERLASEQVRALMNAASSGITASVLENGVIRFLLANDKYFEILGFTRESYDAEVKNIFDRIHPEDREMVKRESLRSYNTGEGLKLEYRVIARSGEELWVQAVVTRTRFTGVALPVQVCMFTDVTAEKQAERALQKTDEQLKFLNDMAHILLGRPDSDSGIEAALWRLLDYFGGSRAYVFEFDYQHSVSNNSYEVCADGVTREKDKLQNVPIEYMSFWVHAFDARTHISIADVNSLDDSRADERRILGEQGIKSLIAVPLRRDGQLIGFIGVDDPGRHQEQVSRLDAIGDYIAVMLTRRDLDSRIDNDNKILVDMMNDTPGGFVRMLVNSNGSIVPLYFNSGFCRLVGMNFDELMAMYKNDAMAGVHAEDVGVVREAVARLLKNGEAHSGKYRLRRGGGGYVWVMFFGRVTKNDGGETCLNIYYTDASSENKLETNRRELLDNMPCGAALYLMTGSKLTAVHLNRRYRELVGRELLDLSKTSVIDAVHPDDRASLWAEVRLAIQEKRDIDCNFRLLYGQDEYRSFHVTGRVVPRADGEYAIYAAYAPIIDEKRSYQEMLPVALAAVMSSGSDLSFVKDRSFRYICCSRSFARLNGLADEKEVVGKTDYDLMDKRFADKYRKVEEEIAASGQARLDLDELLPTGGLRYGCTSKYPLLDASGNVIGIYGVTRDITEYHAAFERLQLLTDSLPGGIASFEIGPSGMRLGYFNEGFYSFSGYEREEYMRLSNADPLFLVFPEDRPAVRAAIASMREGRPSAECTVRCRLKDEGYRWFSMRGAVSERMGDTLAVNLVMFDVTERREAEERLRVSEEQFRVAAALSDRMVARYDIKTGLYHNDDDILLKQGFGHEIPNVPEAFIEAGAVAEESIEDFRGMYQKLKDGGRSATATTLLRQPDGSFRWFRMDATSIFGGDSRPSEAIIVFFDVTEQREKEAVYKRWKQSMQERPSDSYTLFRCNLSKNSGFESVEGTLLKINYKGDADFNARTMEYVEQYVYPDDRQEYISTLNQDTLLANYYRGNRTGALEYREIISDDQVRWLRRTVELVEYPDSTDVLAYLMFENIDEAKQAELQTQARAQNDPLTGVLNRGAFTERADRLLASSVTGRLCALFMLDVDGFKLVNDTFGHAVGDRALIDLARTLRSVLRRGDLLGRLGGDEFVVFLADVPNRAVAGKKAEQICALARKSYSLEVSLSVSVGVAVSPDDGDTFDALYQRADAALYHIKDSGKDSYAFYSGKMSASERAPDEEAAALPAGAQARMLIVDDNKLSRDMLVNIFRDEFIVDTADSGASALARLRRYGAGVSVVLLDLVMPGLDGFAVLEKMRASRELRGVPVVVVSGANERETCLKAIKFGAADFVTKPVDVDLLRLRVESAISRAENDRLRAQNRALSLQAPDPEGASN